MKVWVAAALTVVVPIIGGLAIAQDENPTTPGAIPNPGTYQGSTELQRQSDRQDQQFRQQQQSQSQHYGQPSSPTGGGRTAGGGASSAPHGGPSTCDFVKIAVVDAINDFRDIADGSPPAKGFIKLKDYIFPVGWTSCGVGIGNGGPVLICTINSPQGRPAGEGQAGIRQGTKVIGACVPAGWRVQPRADGVNFEDSQGVNKLSLTVGEHAGGAYVIALGIASPRAVIPKQ